MDTLLLSFIAGGVWLGFIVYFEGEGASIPLSLVGILLAGAVVFFISYSFDKVYGGKLPIDGSAFQVIHTTSRANTGASGSATGGASPPPQFEGYTLGADGLYYPNATTSSKQ